ncbi:MAG: hypothetical protein R3242_00390 [Akkermansiaceae bacterium]|nr:hypothetical protein [Akkermansiaceae bacterium]
MKLLCTLFSFGLAVIPLSASEVIDARRAEETGKKYEVYETGDGQVFRDVQITRITDGGISIIHAEGSARLRYESLSAEARKKFGITKEGAEAIYAKERKAKASYQAKIAAIQKKRQEERQKAHEEMLAKQEAAILEAERSEAQKTQQPQGKTTIVSALEVPHFPIIRGSDQEVFYPIQRDSHFQRNRYYRSGGTIYYGSPGGYRGGSYGYPCRSYPSGGGYHHGHHLNSGWLRYRSGNFTITTHW